MEVLWGRGRFPSAPLELVAAVQCNVRLLLAETDICNANFVSICSIWGTAPDIVHHHAPHTAFNGHAGSTSCCLVEHPLLVCHAGRARCFLWVHTLPLKAFCRSLGPSLTDEHGWTVFRIPIAIASQDYVAECAGCTDFSQALALQDESLDLMVGEACTIETLDGVISALTCVRGLIMITSAADADIVDSCCML